MVSAGDSYRAAPHVRRFGKADLGYAPKRTLRAWRLLPCLTLVGFAFATTLANGVNTAHASVVERFIPISHLPQRAGALAPREVANLRGHGSQTSSLVQSSARALSSGTPPLVHQSFQGIFDPSIVPPDTNGAAGPTRQVEIINLMVGIWSRSSPPVLLTQQTLEALTGSSGTALGDPRVVWDPQTSRFYYTVLDDTNSALLTGFSTTASPSSAADWCRYAMPQTNGIDMPHLGDSKDFILVGFYLFHNGPEVAWYTKPAAGTTCPASLASGMQAMPSAGGYPPVPAHEVDVQSTGYVLAAGNGTNLTMVKVTKSGSGSAIFSAPSSISVPPLHGSAARPQQGSGQLIDVFDARLQEAVGAVDPPGQGSSRCGPSIRSRVGPGR